jgi:hypothetical protein
MIAFWSQAPPEWDKGCVPDVEECAVCKVCKVGFVY